MIFGWNLSGVLLGIGRLAWLIACLAVAWPSATAAEAASELSYCLCSYECAVEFVLQVDEAQLERMSVAGSLSASMSLPAALSNVTQTF